VNYVTQIDIYIYYIYIYDYIYARFQDISQHVTFKHFFNVFSHLFPSRFGETFVISEHRAVRAAPSAMASSWGDKTRLANIKDWKYLSWEFSNGWRHDGFMMVFSLLFSLEAPMKCLSHASMVHSIDAGKWLCKLHQVEVIAINHKVVSRAANVPLHQGAPVSPPAAMDWWTHLTSVAP